MNLSQDSNFAWGIKYRHYFAGPIIGYLLDKHGKNYKIVSLEQFKKNKNPSILLGSLYLIGEYKKRNI